MESDNFIRIKGIEGDCITLIENTSGKQITRKEVMVNSIIVSVPNESFLINEEESKIFLVCDINGISYFGFRTESGEEYLIDTKTTDNYNIKKLALHRL